MTIQTRFLSDKILSAEAACVAEPYDLENRDRLFQQTIQLLAQHRRDICLKLQHYLAAIFNDSPDDVNWGELTVRQISEIAFDDSRTLWLKGQSEQTTPSFLMIDCETLHAFSVIFLGGSVKETQDVITVNQMTDTEIRLGRQFFEQQIQLLTDATSINTAAFVQTENVAADSLPKTGRWIDICFSISLSQKLFTWHLYWPVNEQEESQDQPTTNPAVVQQLLKQIPVQLKMVLAEQTIPLNHLSNLKVGDVLPIELTDPSPAYLGQQVFLEGRVAEQRSHLVFQVLSVKNK